MHVFTDQVGQTISLASVPKRIISLVPSQTELLYELGLDRTVAGITKFCVHPDSWYRTKTRVGGTKQVHLDRIHQLQPDLVLANKEENRQQDVAAIAEHYPVWTSDITTLQDALAMISSIGELTDTTRKAVSLVEAIEDAFLSLPAMTTKPKVAYLIWKDPWMCAGGDTFINSMLTAAGFENVFSYASRYPVITDEDIFNSGCQYLLLSSEPYPFSQKHLQQLQEQWPGIKMILADGEMFSWYGSRMLLAPAYFSALRQQMKI